MHLFSFPFRLDSFWSLDLVFVCLISFALSMTNRKMEEKRKFLKVIEEENGETNLNMMLFDFIWMSETEDKKKKK